ncbi:MAG: hypothetical protein M0Z30_03330 [Actinomycetota bacterium]|nr:hypothetical protein [Actinomycetota bacterium]
MSKLLMRSAVAAAVLAGGGATVAGAGAFENVTPSAARSGPAPAVVTDASLTASVATPSPSAGLPTACDSDGHWPAYVQGRPDGFDAGDDGVYIWHNPAGGWGLRVSHPLLPGRANRVVFSGTVTSAGTIGHVVRVRDEVGDQVVVGPHGHTLYFHFVDYGGVDGVDFTTTCTPGLQVALAADGAAMAPAFVHLGDRDTHPGTNPFLIRRADRDTGTSPA